VIYLIVLGFAAAGNAAMLFFCEQTRRHVLARIMREGWRV
jgi:hypothetical protein